MNILTDALPDTVEIGGQEYLLSTDYRSSLRVIMAFEDSELTPQEKQVIILSNLYPVCPENIEVALEKASQFLNGGSVGDDNQGESSPRLYSFSKDAGFIFSAFRQTHGIDLETAELHWWKFLALFMDLGSETTFCQLVGMRSRIKKGTASKEEKQAAREMGDLIDIPEIDDRTLEEKEKENEFMKLVAQGYKK